MIYFRLELVPNNGNHELDKNDFDLILNKFDFLLQRQVHHNLMRVNGKSQGMYKICITFMTGL